MKGMGSRFLVRPGWAVRWVSWILLWHSCAIQGPASSAQPPATPANGAGKAVSAPPAPVKDALGHIAVYASEEAAKGDVFGQLADFSNRAEMVSQAVRLRDFVWNALGVRRARPPEAVPIQITRSAQVSDTSADVRTEFRAAGPVVRVRFPDSLEPRSELFKRAIIVAALSDLMSRNPRARALEAGTSTVPRWLVDALVHLDRAPEPVQISDALAALPSQNPFQWSIEELLSRPEKNPVSVGDSSEAAVLAARCFLSFLELEATRSNAILEWLQSDPVRISVSDLNRYFAGIGGSAAEVYKSWTVHVAALRLQRSRISMTAIETERALERLLEMDVVTAGNVRHLVMLENFEEYVRMPGIESVLRARRLELLALASSAHFMFEPVIHAYAELCADLADRRTKLLGERFRRARMEWQHVKESLEKTRDYLNWWESLPRSDSPAPELREFYQALDDADLFRTKVSRSLDAWEKRIQERDRRADWKRIVEESDSRPVPKAGQR